jgi:sulfonate transport system ATP-binding protein
MSDTRRVKIEVEDLTKEFGGLLVLDKINFQVYEGEFLVIVGPTGCGKTTFMNLLSKMTPITRGSIKIDGEEVDLQKHNLAYILQEPSCIPWLTVDQNLTYGFQTGRRKHLLNNPETQERIKELKELTGLKKYSGFFPNNLSVSLQQLVVVARAFAIDPHMLLMDEPYGQLDLKTRLALESEILNIWRTLKKTIIFVTHNIEEAVYIGERIIVLTNKPTTVKKEINLDLPHPRDVVDPQFVKIRDEITELIKWW